MNSRMDKLREIFKKRGVLLAYLFGSQKDTGKRFLEGLSYEIGEPSDLDLGLLVAPVPETLYERYGNLYLELSRVFAPFNIDIVLLHEIHSLLKYEIISGYRLYAEDEPFADDYEDLVVKFASDLAVKRRMFEPDFVKAIEDGHFEIEHH